MDQLDREDSLRRVSTALRIAGIGTMALGLLCFPAGAGLNPKRDLSVFANLADLGLFWKTGLVLLALGAVILVASFLTPGGEEEA
jgi:hypothetical protein